jgi:hypothetical protein
MRIGCRTSVRTARPSFFPGTNSSVFLHGSAKARIDGVELDVAGGTATRVPAGVSHEFWNPFGEPFEFILIMFGEGA